MSLALIDIALIILLLLLTIFIIKRLVDYLVKGHLTAEEKLFLNECSQAICRAKRDYLFAGPSAEKPYHVCKIEDNQRAIACLKAVLSDGLSKDLSFQG